ncbi:MAG: leucine-rich repeat domain-containing protein, partial [Muribaculaceae bacterium]|nr:leucine-rich repeat domain-containing protein [Muribaculaceae bacterium]
INHLNLIMKQILQMFVKPALLSGLILGPIGYGMASATVVEGSMFVYDINEAEGTAAIVAFDKYADDFTRNPVIPNTVMYDDKEYPIVTIGESAFFNSKIDSVVLGENVKTIEEFAFLRCRALDITLNEGLETIGTEAFENCEFETLILPSTLKSIGDYAFMGNKALSGQVHLPSSIESIGKNPWRSLTGVSAITLDDTNGFFASQDGVLYSKDMSTLYVYPAGKEDNEFVIPSAVKNLEDMSMRNNIFLHSVDLSNVESIGEMTFASSQLTSLHLPSSIKHIGKAAFYNNLGLESLTVAADNSVFKTEDGMLIDNEEKTIVFSVFKSGDLIIPDGIVEIGDYAFYQYDITTLKTPASLKRIDKCAFAESYALSQITINEGLEHIGDMAFQNCEKLSEFTFPSTLKSIGLQGFLNTGLKKAILNEGLESINTYAFLRCLNIEEVYLPSTLTYVDEAIFSECTSLVKAVLAEGLTSTYPYTFESDIALKEVSLPSTLVEIGPYSFYGSGIESIDIPDGVTKICRAGLYQTQLKSVKLPDSVEELEEFALAWNERLSDFTAGSGLKIIGRVALHNLKNLTEVTLNEGLEEIGEEAFSNAESLESFTIPSTVTQIENGIFRSVPLKTLINHAVVPQPLDDDILFMPDMNPYESCLLEVPQESIEAYKMADIWNKFYNIEAIESGVDTVSNDLDATIKEIYTLDGRRIENPSTGIYIFRMSDGSTRKSVVK